MAFGLSEAFASLLAFWQANPAGGTRAAFITQQTAAGFVEPMLNEWLDELLRGLRDSGYITNMNYDMRIPPLIASVGLPAVVLATTATFNFLNQPGFKLYKLTRQFIRDTLTTQIDLVQVDIDALQAGKDTIQALSSFTGKQLCVGAINARINTLQVQKSSLQTSKQMIVEELAEL